MDGVKKDLDVERISSQDFDEYSYGYEKKSTETILNTLLNIFFFN